MLELKIDQNVLSLSGRLDGQSAPELENTFLTIENDFQEFYFDMKRLSYISSAGIRALLKITKALKTKDKHLSLCSLDENILSVLQISGLLRIFDVYSDLESARKLLLEGKNTASEYVISGSNYLIKMDETAESHLYSYKSVKEPIRVTPAKIKMGFGKGSISANGEDEGCSEFIILSDSYISINSEVSDLYLINNIKYNHLQVNEVFAWEGSPALYFSSSSSGDIKSHLENLLARFFLKEKAVKGAFIAFGKDHERMNYDVYSGIYSMNHDSGRTDYLTKIIQTSVEEVLEDSLPDRLLNQVINMENFISASELTESRLAEHVFGWIYPFKEESDFRKILLSINLEDDINLSLPEEDILKSLFADMKKISLKTMHGGFTSRVFRVNAFDAHDRKVMP